MSRIEDDLFTYEVEIAEVTNIPCNLKRKDDSEQQMSHGSDDDMEYDLSNAREDDEVELTDEESSDFEDEDEATKFFRIETNGFDFETPLCRAFKEFNYLLEIDPDLLTKDIEVFNWSDNGYCNGGNLPGAYIVGNALRCQDFKWYEALKDGKLKEEALKNKAIMEGITEDEDNESSNEGPRCKEIDKVGEVSII
ncbi:hypothetical protein Tco_1161256 [Tanacetum coccineum]